MRAASRPSRRPMRNVWNMAGFLLRWRAGVCGSLILA
ncbi:Uncharacterised protein [Mycobacteroides abscessus subsp. abscessus]|nr:Uncharacterised protein [Mycobacteroides abscessus subsp. abscessus]